MTQDLYKLASVYQEACKAYRAEMDKRGPVTTAVTKEEVATRGAMRQAEHDLIAAAEDVDPGLPESIRAKVLALAANYARAEGLYREAFGRAQDAGADMTTLERMRLNAPEVQEAVGRSLEAQRMLHDAALGLELGERSPFVLPDLRLGRAEKLMVEEALARAGSMRLAAQLLDITPARLRSALKRHGIVWPRVREDVP